MSGPKRPDVPEGLSDAGRGLWTRMHDALAEGLRFSARERELLHRVCSMADREQQLRDLIERDGPTITGSTGQTVLHPAIAELRLTENAVCSLLRQVSLEDTDGKPQSLKSQRAAAAADARWSGHRQQEERRLKVARGG